MIKIKTIAKKFKNKDYDNFEENESTIRLEKIKED